MKKLVLLIVSTLIISALIMSFTGCSNLSPDDGIKELKSAYKNSKENFSDIYQYSEKIYNKALLDQMGHIVNRRVNVNCAVNNKYELIKDKDYAINIYEEKYDETIDKTSAISSKRIGFNEIIAGKTKSNIDALFLKSGKFAMENGKEKWTENGYAKSGVNAKDFYNSEYYNKLDLMNLQVMKEIENIDAKDMNFDVKKGGIVKKGKTTDFTFMVTQDYLTNYEKDNAKPSIFVGAKRIWIQISYNRISNIYIYKEEDLGGALSVDYESYTLMITYLGPKIGVPEMPSPNDKNPQYDIKDIFDGNNFKDNLLFVM